MKSILLSAMAFLAILTSVDLNAAPNKGSGVKTGIGVSDTPISTRRLSPSTEGVGSAPPIIEIYAALTPRDTSPNFKPTIRQWISDVRAGTEVVLPFGAVPTGNILYSSIPNGAKAPWYGFVYSRTEPMFAGVLTPGGSEHGYTITYMARLRAMPGEKVRLSMITEYSFDSNDGGTSHGSLYESGFITNPAHTDLALGYNGNDVVDSGSGDQDFDEVITVFWDYPYNEGGVQTGLDEVERYVKSIPNFSQTFTLYAGGIQESRTVETAPSSLLSVRTVESRVVVTARVPGLLQTSTDLITWSDFGQVAGGFILDDGVLSDPFKFFRLMTR